MWVVTDVKKKRKKVKRKKQKAKRNPVKSPGY